MSKPNKQRFKGVENFLRRVAYNLGNTPSQTEVKIISCIPIDVTDLQAKIQFLERQLHETSKNNTKTPSPLNSPPAKPKSPPVTPTPERKKSDTGCDKGGAVDDKNREACNKDCALCGKNGAVGDKASKPNTSGTIVNTVLYGGPYANQSLSDKSCNKTYSGSSYRHRKSNVSFALPVIMTTSKDEHPHCSFSSHENVDTDNAMKNISEAERKLAAAEHYFNNLLKIAKKKRKVCRGKSKMKTQLVYFAQHTQNNPFNSDSLDPFETLNNNRVGISHDYLDNVIRKQYDPKFVVQEFSDTSHFSRPVCRDVCENLARSHLYESDVCSCCHGRFQNIDDYMPKGFNSINNLMKSEPNYINKTYYDSNLYDVVPVKEDTNKFLKENNLPKRDIEIRCWPEQFRSKHRNYPKTVKYQAESPLKRRDNLNFQKIKLNEKSEHYNVEQMRINNQVHETSKVTPKRCYIDSKINKNDTYLSAKVKKSEPVKTIVLKNELIGTDNNNINTKLLLKNQSTQLELIPEDNKTEATLNQIKSILESVLAEVKTNPKVNKSMEKTPKRDAVVQKGSSQFNMQGQSTLLHSYTYNHSYNANPYLPSCSRQLSAGQYCLAGVPYQPSLKYLQNFPVFIHPSSGRRLCACYYKNSSHKSSKHKQASAAATNTNKEIAEETEKNGGNKETEKLIKEIYKSMNLDFPTKENSVSEYDDLKSTENDLKSNVRDVRSTGMKVVDKRDVEVEALITSNESNDSNVMSNNTFNRPVNKSQTSEARRNNNFTNTKTNHDEILHRFEQRSTETITEDDEKTDTSNDDTEDEDFVDIKEYETQPKHERKGLLQRMFNSVKMFKKRKTDQKIHYVNEEASEASDSDDYETIYSGRTAVLQPKDRRQSHKYKTSSKGKLADQTAFIRALHEKNRRSPYLEQEFRRQWNERLMFDKLQERKYSSERPLSRQSPLKDARPVYWNEYEARSAIVDNNVPSPLQCVNSKAKVSKKCDSLHKINDSAAKDKLRWLKKHKLAKCGEQWKKFVLEN